MFESFTKKSEGRGKRLSGLLLFSLCFHGVLIAVILLLDYLRVEPVPQPPVTVTFVDFASLPPPPPPPPPPKKRSRRKTEPKIEKPKPQPKIKEFVAPKEIPREKPKEPEQGPEDEGLDEGVEGGVEGGVVGGVVGGVIGGVLSDQPPPPAPPPPPPPPPKYQAPAVIDKRRIAGRQPEYPKIARAAGLEATIVVKIFITPDGKVGEIKFLKSDKHFEQAVRDALATWRFKPLMINGRPVGTYTVYKFVFKLD